MLDNEQIQEDIHMKKRYYALILFLMSTMMAGCGATASQSKSAQQDSTPQQETSNSLITKGKEHESMPDASTYDRSQMEFDGSDEITIEQLIDRLSAKGIASGEPKEHKDAVKGALKTVQIGNAVIVEFDPNDLNAFLDAQEAKKLNFQGTDYKIVSINQNFMLLLLDDTDETKADEAFRQTDNENPVIIF